MMKVAIFGRKVISKRMVKLLTAQGIEIEDAPNMQDEDGIDLAIIDSLVEDAESIYSHIEKLWNVPLLVIIDERNSDWEKLYLANADGYLSEKIRSLELKARLEATLRRFLLKTKCADGFAGKRDIARNIK